MADIPVISSHVLHGLPAFIRREMGEKALLAKRAVGLDLELIDLRAFRRVGGRRASEGLPQPKHRQQWTNTLKTYAAPIWAMRLDEIGTDDVLGVLQPIWTTKAETASRVRGRIERVLDAAKAKGLRSGENPARWRGHLSTLLSKRQRLTRGHHAALPYADVPTFVAELRQRQAVAALALEFIILTAARAGEVTGAQWNEVDLDAKVWTVPAARMKAAREHRVPLTDRAIEVLRAVEKIRTSDFVFPGQRQSRPLSLIAFHKLMERMKRNDITTHGFRSSFRDWAGEATSFSRELAEMALAHSVGDATEQAYRRGDAFRRQPV